SRPLATRDPLAGSCGTAFLGVAPARTPGGRRLGRCAMRIPISLGRQYAPLEIASPPLRLPSALYVTRLMDCLRKWTEPSVKPKLAPPGCWLLNPLAALEKRHPMGVLPVL